MVRHSSLSEPCIVHSVNHGGSLSEPCIVHSVNLEEDKIKEDIKEDKIKEEVKIFKLSESLPVEYKKELLVTENLKSVILEIPDSYIQSIKLSELNKINKEKASIINSKLRSRNATEEEIDWLFNYRVEV